MAENKFFPSLLLNHGYILSSKKEILFWNIFEYVMGLFFFCFLVLSIVTEEDIYNFMAVLSLFMCDLIPALVLKNHQKVENRQSFFYALSKFKIKIFVYAVLVISIVSAIYDVVIEEVYLSNIAWILYLIYFSYIFLKRTKN